MTKQQLLDLLQAFNTHINNSYESNSGAGYKAGAKLFIEFLDEQKVLSKEPQAPNVPNWDEIAKVNGFFADFKRYK